MNIIKTAADGNGYYSTLQENQNELELLNKLLIKYSLRIFKEDNNLGIKELPLYNIRKKV